MHFAAYLVTAFSSAILATAAAGPPALLYNTYQNTARACVSDCHKAARQVCAGDLSKPIGIIKNQPPAVFLNATVGKCMVRYFNANYNQTGFTTADECILRFTSLIHQTSPAADKSCTLRIGGIFGNDANGVPTGEPVFAYMPVDTPTDGFESSLEGVGTWGKAIVPDTLYSVGQTRCKTSANAAASANAVASAGVSRRDVAVSVRDVALYERGTTGIALACTGLGIAATATALCTWALMTGFVVSLGPLGFLGAPWCIGLAWLGGVGETACVYESFRAPDDGRQDEQTGMQAGSNKTSSGGGGRRLRIRGPTYVDISRLDRRLTVASDADYCNTTVVREFQASNPCLVDAVSRKCGIPQN